MAAPSGTNFGSKRALGAYGSSAAFRFEVPTRACGRWCRNFKSAALGSRREASVSGPMHSRRDTELQLLGVTLNGAAVGEAAKRGRRAGSERPSEHPGGVPHVLRVLGDFLQIRPHRATEFGELDTRLAVEYRAAELALERANCVGQGGLGDAAAPRRAREVQFFTERQEVADLMHFHGWNPSAGLGPCLVWLCRA